MVYVHEGDSFVTSGVMRILTNIQILRALAAMAVVLYHVLANAGFYGAKVDWLNPMADWGDNGVDLFFVISGFIMIHIQRRQAKSPAGFMIDRLARVAPLYYLVTIGLFLIGHLAPSLFHSTPAPYQNLAWSLLFVHQIMDSGHMPLLYVGWTLEYEMYFYAAFALSLLVGPKSLRLALLIVAILALTEWGGGNRIAIEFLFGVGIGLLVERFHSPAIVGSLAMVLGGGLILLAVPYPAEADSIWSSRLLRFGLPSALLVFGALTVRQTRSNLLTAIGDASYSIYLVQVISVSAFYKVVAATGLNVRVQHDLLACMCFVCTVAAGMFLYRWVEMPLHGLVKRGLAPSTPAAAS
jgi:exopolysaccharide production protein ExoZ